MNVKKLAIIGMIAFVVIGCVLAAGCTSNTTSTDNSSPLTGMWSTEYTYDDGTTVPAIMYLNPNGEECWMALDDSVDGMRFLEYYEGVWDVTGDNTLTITGKLSKNKYTYVYDKTKGTLTYDDNYVYTKAEPIVGIWSGTSSNRTGNGKTTMIFKPDGTGIDTIGYSDGTGNVSSFTWKKNADGIIAVISSNGANRTYTIAADEKTLKTDDNRTLTKQFVNGTGMGLTEITGAWVSKDKKYNAILNGDGIGSYYITNPAVGVCHFTWKWGDNGKIIVNYKDGKTQDGNDIKGKEYLWTYNRNNFELTDGDGNVFVRPTESGTGIDLNFKANEPWVGVWVRSSADDTGKGIDTLKYLTADGKEVYMILDTENKGIRFKEFDVGTWVKTSDSTFTITDEKTKEKYDYTYNKTNNTIISSGTNHAYTKVEPIAGIWSGTSSDRTANGKSTLIFKPDGTGMNTIGHPDEGTVEIYGMTWKKNSDGTIVATFSSGFVRNFTVSADGRTIISDDNRVFTKEFLDGTFLVETIGAWYNKDKNHTAYFNADGTGFYNNSKNGLAHFTWKFGDVPKTIILTYIDGVTDSGKEDIKGKVYTWTYNPEKDELTDGDGYVFSRTKESVEGKITYH